MGGSLSKVGRTLPAKARVHGVTDIPPVSRSRLVARDQEIDRDGKDPQLLANLSRMGQVKVQYGAGPISSTANQVSQMYKARDMAEQQASSARPVHNRLLAGSLCSLLDDRKFVTSRSELEQLAARYNVDVPTLDRLARFVNTPSIGEGTVVRLLGEDGQETITMQAVWTEPNMKDDPRPRRIHSS